MSEWGSIWSIWIDRPGHPGKHLVRRDDLPFKGQGPSFVAAADNLAEARSLLPVGLILARRNEREDPAMLEAWLDMPDR